MKDNRSNRRIPLEGPDDFQLCCATFGVWPNSHVAILLGHSERLGQWAVARWLSTTDAMLEIKTHDNLGSATLDWAARSKPLLEEYMK